MRLIPISKWDGTLRVGLFKITVSHSMRSARIYPTTTSGSGSLRKGGDTEIVTAPASERHSQGMHAELLLVLSCGSEVDSDAK